MPIWSSLCPAERLPISLRSYGCSASSFSESELKIPEINSELSVCKRDTIEEQEAWTWIDMSVQAIAELANPQTLIPLLSSCLVPKFFSSTFCFLLLTSNIWVILLPVPEWGLYKTFMQKDSDAVCMPKSYLQNSFTDCLKCHLACSVLIVFYSIVLYWRCFPFLSYFGFVLLLII